jgi:DnaJ-class molecular chaperone
MALIIIAVVIIAVGYLISVRLHPLTKCPSCKMSGRHFGSIYSGTYRRCRKCEGRGQLDRLGTRVFYGGTNNTGVFRK